MARFRGLGRSRTVAHGELSMLTGQRLYLSGVVSGGGEVIGDAGVVGLQSVYDLAD